MPSLKEIRKELQITQQRLAEKAEVSISAVENAEKKRKMTSRLVAKAILAAINDARKARGLSEYTTADIDWTIKE